MAVDERAGRRRKGEGQPDELARTTPPQLPERNWLVQTLMGLQKTVEDLSRAVGMLTGRVERLEEKVDRIDRKVERINHKLDRINHGVCAVVVVLTCIGAVALWFLNAASDEIVSLAKEALLRSVE